VGSCNKGLPAKMLKPHWHDLLMILKQFITCEGRYAFVFLFHLRLLMVFMGFKLIMPHYLHRSLFKMAKKYKRSRADTILFHVGLIKILVVYELGLRRDSWPDFPNRNGFEESNRPPVDKPVVSESKSTPIPYSVLLPKPKPDPPVNSLMAVTNVAKPITTEARENTTTRNKRNARMISCMERNKSKPPAKTEPVMISEDSESSIERFLAEEGFCGEQTHYNFIDNLPPCLRDNPDYPGIKPSRQTLGESSKPPVAQKVASPCDQCGLWLEKYYSNVPKLQSKIHNLEKQLALLTGQDAKGRSSDKNQRTARSISFKNVESATVVVNSRLT
jgi:hypothetical protein